LEFLSVADSFDMAFSNKEAWKNVDENGRVGVEYIYAQLHSAFERENLKAFDPEGETFDPLRHDSIELIPVEAADKDDRILEVVQKGYMLGKQVVRPAKVKVGKKEN
jgi:molecular chaperone GrpE